MKKKENSQPYGKAKPSEQVKKFSENENLFEQVFKHSIVPILIHDMELNIMDANNSALEQFGYSKEELLQKKVTDLHDESEIEHSQAVLNKMKKSNILSVETIFKRKDDSIFYAEATPFKYKFGDKTLIHVYIQDISERKATEEMLKSYTQNLEVTVNQRTSELQNSLKAQELLVKEIHHRVKNNLQILNSIFSLYASKEKDSKVIEAINMCRNNILSLGIVYESIFPAKSKGHISFHNYVSKLCTHLEKSLAANASIPIIQSLEEVELSIDQAVNCGLILNEAITNAYKHAFPNGKSGQIVLTLKNKAKKVFLSIEDNGVGLPSDFDLEDSANFGLDLIQILVKQLQGRVDISNGNGLKIEIEFSA